MTRKPVFWHLLMASAVGLELLAVLLLFTVHWHIVGWVLLGGLMALHILEIKTAQSIGKSRGLPAWKTAGMTMLFGFTWWLPVRLGVF